MWEWSGGRRQEERDEGVRRKREGGGDSGGRGQGVRAQPRGAQERVQRAGVHLHL